MSCPDMRPVCRARRKLAGAAIGALAFVMIPGVAVAQPLVDTAETAPAQVRALDQLNLDDDGRSVITKQDRKQVAPGVELVTVSRLDAGGRLDFSLVTADIGSGQVRGDYLFPGAVSAAVPLSQLLVDNGAIAAVNGSFFDINNSNAPQGIGVSSTHGIVTVPDGAGDNPVVFTTDGRGAVAPVTFEGTAVVNGQTSITISGVNTSTLREGNVALFDERWGDYTRSRATGAGAVEVAVDTATWTVTQVSEGAGTGTVPAGVVYLTARAGAGAELLRTVTAGDRIDISTTVTSPAGEVASALGGNTLLVRDGNVLPQGDPAVHPRTAVGFSDDGATLYLLVVDGRQEISRGLSLAELGTLMRQLGAQDAVNLDGGGSTTMAVREPTRALSRSAAALPPSIPNSPSDGAERLVPNGIGLFLAEGKGAVDSYELRTQLTSADSERVLPGLRRTVVAYGVDERGTSVDGIATEWSASDGSTVRPDGATGVLTGGSTRGTVTVTASGDGAAGSIDLTVLGELQRLAVSSRAIQLADTSSSAELTVYGVDDRGYRAPIEAADVTVTGDGIDSFELSPSSTGTFAVRATSDSAAARATLTVGEQSIDVAITAGVEEKTVLDFSDLEGWRTTGARATHSVAADTTGGRDGSQGARLTFDFSQDPATRTANARPAAGHSGYEVPGQPTELRVWAKGETTGRKNADTYIGYSDANGSWKYIYGAAPQGTEWTQLSYPLPEGTAYPIHVQMVSAYETRGAEQYSGAIVFDDLVAVVPTEADLPQESLVTDDVIVPTGATAASPLRLAVLSDAQFVARDPESGAVRGAREALREIVAQNPDVLVINGDFVDEGSVADFALAKTILDEELAGVDFPWFYVPGNHETMGASIENFTSAFGPTHQVEDVDGVRLIMLDTSTGRLSHDLEQVRMFQNALTDAATNPDVEAVVVVQHMPLDDPLTSKNSQLADRLDAEMQRRWIEEFAQESGKSIGMVAGHVGVFHAKTEDNVPMVINGNSGKAPTDAPFGEFTGWTMIGLDTAAVAQASSTTAALSAPVTAAQGWFAAEVMTRAESVSLGADLTELEAGTSVHLAPTVLQDGTRVVPVTWPVSHRWEGSDTVWFGTPQSAPQEAVLAVDLTTNEVHALRGGSATLVLTVNTAQTQVDVQVAGVTGEVPIVSGIAQAGQELTAQAGQWGPQGVALSYRWFADAAEVPGATDATFTPSAEHVGAAMSVAVTGTAGDMAPLTLTSQPTAAVVAADVEPATITADRSELRVGESLQVSGAGFSPSVTVELWLEPQHLSLGSVQTGSDGTFGAGVAVPASALPGSITLRAVDDVRQVEASLALTLLAVPGSGGEPDGDGAGGEPGEDGAAGSGADGNGSAASNAADGQGNAAGGGSGLAATGAAPAALGLLGAVLLAGGLLARRRARSAA